VSINSRGIYGDPLIGAPLPAGYHPGDIIVDATGVVETMGGCSTTNGVGAASIVCGVSLAGQAGDVLVTALVPGSGAGTLAFSFDP
jgi:hypothetical protein